LATRQVLHVQEVHADLTCDFAVSEQHGDVEDGSAGKQGQRLGARLDPTGPLKEGQSRTGQNLVAARCQLWGRAFCGPPLPINESSDVKKRSMEEPEVQVESWTPGAASASCMCPP
jgi:hypothetical protein